MLNGIQFIEYSSSDPEALEALFKQLGFACTHRSRVQQVDVYSQGRMHFLLNKRESSFAGKFAAQHGPSIASVGFFVDDPAGAKAKAQERGARPLEDKGAAFLQPPAVYGVGDSLMYFVKGSEGDFALDSVVEGLEPVQGAPQGAGAGLDRIDHLTNNVPVNQMDRWCAFYSKVFGFRQVREFKIEGQQTGLVSKVMVSENSKVIIPVNEPRGEKSQIQEYIDTYKGSGVQHVALSSKGIVQSVEWLRSKDVHFLKVPDTYYEALPRRLSGIKENLADLQKNRILADGDDEGYLLQIFTQNVVGPIFYEIIERHSHDGFGEGNFQALFDSMEEDQRRRGYL